MAHGDDRIDIALRAQAASLSRDGVFCVRDDKRVQVAREDLRSEYSEECISHRRGVFFKGKNPRGDR